jgi:adenylylsulfate kinase
MNSPTPWIEARWRSLFKAISWRIFATVTTMVISFLITKSIKFALTIGFLEATSKIVLYYIHERAWNAISIGKRHFSLS